MTNLCIWKLWKGLLLLKRGVQIIYLLAFSPRHPYRLRRAAVWARDVGKQNIRVLGKVSVALLHTGGRIFIAYVNNLVSAREGVVIRVLLQWRPPLALVHAWQYKNEREVTVWNFEPYNLTSRHGVKADCSAREKFSAPLRVCVSYAARYDVSKLFFMFWVYLSMSCKGACGVVHCSIS